MKFVDSASQKIAMDDFLELCTRILKRGLLQSPKEIAGLFQGYVSHRFVELFGSVAPEESRLSLLFQRFCSDDAFASSLVSILIKQGHYIGEIKGMIEILAEGIIPLSNKRSLNRRLRGASSQGSSKSLSKDMHRATRNDYSPAKAAAR